MTATIGRMHGKLATCVTLLCLGGCQPSRPTESPPAPPRSDVTAAQADSMSPVDLRAPAQPDSGLPPSGVAIGEPMPLFELPRVDGSGSASLADFRGQKTILHIFASW